MACSGCGGAVTTERVKAQVDVDGNPVQHQVRFPNGIVRKFWSAEGAQAAVLDYDAVIITVNGEAIVDGEVVSETDITEQYTYFDALPDDALRDHLAMAGIDFKEDITRDDAIKLLLEASTADTNKSGSKVE